jgi:hypothetical protein
MAGTIGVADRATKAADELVKNVVGEVARDAVEGVGNTEQSDLLLGRSG